MLARRLWSGEANHDKAWNIAPFDAFLVRVREIVLQAAALWGENDR